MSENILHKGVSEVPQKGKERIRKEKLVKKRNALREKEEMRKERAMEKAVKGKAPFVYIQISEGGRKYETYTSPKMELRKVWQKPNPEEIRSIIPGVVLSFSVKEGDPVVQNQEIMVYEAMKMHNVIRAPFAGTVSQICVKQGDKLPKGALMLVIRSSETSEATEVSRTSVFQDSLFEDF